MFLNAHTYFSLRFGVLSPEHFVEEAKKFGIRSFVLSDINNSTAVFDVLRFCRKAGIKMIPGIDFRIDGIQKYIGIARNADGFHQLNHFLSDINIQKKRLPDRAPALPGVFFVYPAQTFPSDFRDDEFCGIHYDELNRIDYRFKLIPYHKQLILHTLLFSSEEEHELHRHLVAIDHNTLLTKVPEDCLAKNDSFFISEADLEKRFASKPHLIENTRKLLSNCGFDFDFQGLKNKKSFTQSIEGDHKLLRALLEKGLNNRYGSNNKIARERAFRELKVIQDLGFAAYFLITWDIVQFSMKQGYYHVGRGSGANSIVAYCLRITDVDPIELDLYFERFINKARSSPPDFDIDYSWKERDEVQKYIFRKYGDHAALLGVNSTFRSKSIYRELGKVYGLPKAEIDQLVEHPGREENKNDITFKIHKIAQKQANFPNIRSIHAGGILISEKPITYFGALDMPPKGFPTIQWDMYLSESIGFEKLDILSQRGIGHIRDAAALVRERKAVDVDVHDIPRFKTDKHSIELLKQGETIGCFYIESPAMRGLLRKLRCADYITLVAASSIIRPGVARSGMMKEYIRRFHHPESIQYLHPVMKEQLEETYGVMVYQEDVLKVCHHYAGLDLTDADVLRRAMSGKYRSKKEFERIVQRFFEKSRGLGRPEAVTREVWRQIESFAGYSFSKAHSASYAVESFQSLFLKAHYPLEFMCSVINNFGGFYHSWVYFNEAQRLGGKVELPCVNHSEKLTTLHGNDFYIGFTHIKSLETQLAHDIVAERDKNGLFLDLYDFIRRVGAGKEQMVILIRSGAFRFTGQNKPAMLWEMHLHEPSRKRRKQPEQELFEVPAKRYRLPPLKSDVLAYVYDEMELIGFPVSMSMFELLQTRFRGEIMANDMMNNLGQKVRMLGRLVTLKYVKTVKGDLMHFATFVDVDGQLFDSVHFPPVLKEWPFRGYGIYLILGKVVEEFGYPMLEAEKLALMPLKSDPRSK